MTVALVVAVHAEPCAYCKKLIRKTDGVVPRKRLTAAENLATARLPRLANFHRPLCLSGGPMSEFSAVAHPEFRRVRVNAVQLDLKPSQARAAAFLLLTLADVAESRKVSTGRPPKDTK